jgi:MtN3 and saliva related transmembrane protein
MLNYLGYLAGTLTVVSFIPQVYKTWKTKETKDLSFGAFALLVTACSLWAIYGIIIDDWSVILTNTGMVLLVGSIGVAKLRFG